MARHRPHHHTQHHHNHHHQHHHNHSTNRSASTTHDGHRNQQHRQHVATVSATPSGSGPQLRSVDLRIPAIEKYTYCLCLHVKPTTIFIAVFKLVRALLFASILLNTEFTMNEQVNEHSHLGPIDDRNRSTAAAVSILTRVITASVSALGIYAVISGRAALLMPLYAMLLVDFFFALPAFYNHDLDSAFADGLSDYHKGSSASYSMPMSGTAEQYTRYSLVIFSTIVVLIKIYFLCVVWKCYRYLRLIELITPIRLSELYARASQSRGGSSGHHHQHQHPYPIVSVLGGGAGADQVDLGSSLAPPPYDSITSSMKPPNYEEAMKSCATIALTIINQSNPADLPQGRAQALELIASNQNEHQITVELSNELSPPPQYDPSTLQSSDARTSPTNGPVAANASSIRFVPNDSRISSANEQIPSMDKSSATWASSPGFVNQITTTNLEQINTNNSDSIESRSPNQAGTVENESAVSFKPQNLEVCNSVAEIGDNSVKNSNNHDVAESSNQPR